MAVKEAMKIGVEKGADRVAFVNAPTQIARNNKTLNYVQDKVITKVPTREEILASDEYARELSSLINARYQIYLNDVRDVSNRNAGKPPMSKEEFVLTGPLDKEEFILTGPADPQSYANVQEELQDLTLQRLIDNYGTGRFKYFLEDVGYRLEGDEILNPQRTQLVGDDYDEQRINLRRLTNEDELLEEIPEKFREQVRKDLAAGKKEITLNIDDLEGSGKKFLEIYKNEIPRGINKVLKDLKVKDVKPNISRVLYSDDYNAPIVQSMTSRNVYDEFMSADVDERTGVVAPTKNSRNDDVFVGENITVAAHSSIGIDLTDDMKRKIIQEGLSSMYMGGKVTKSKFMDKPIEGNRREM